MTQIGIVEKMSWTSQMNNNLSCTLLFKCFSLISDAPFPLIWTKIFIRENWKSTQHFLEYGLCMLCGFEANWSYHENQFCQWNYWGWTRRSWKPNTEWTSEKDIDSSKIHVTLQSSIHKMSQYFLWNLYHKGPFYYCHSLISPVVLSLKCESSVGLEALSSTPCCIYIGDSYFEVKKETVHFFIWK